MPQKIFLSYSHKDDTWHQRFRAALTSGIYGLAFQLWSDLDIEVGTNFRTEIDGSIASSRVALLLVSRNFLKSDFIANDELAWIRDSEACKRGELGIWWVPIDSISDPELKEMKLDNTQAAWDPARPLSVLDDKGCAGAIDAILSKLAAELTKTTDDLRQKVAAALGTRTFLDPKPLAEGDYSIFYRAERLGRDVAVKALVPSPHRKWLSDSFVERANTVKEVKNSTAIVIRDVIADPRMQCVVMEYVGLPTLKERLMQGSLSHTVIANVLAQLAGLAGSLHRMKGQPIIGPVRPSHVHYDDGSEESDARISLVPIANETLNSCRHSPTRLMDHDALTYLSPERYAGQEMSAAVDQYYLGLLALELWQGKPPVEVATFADLEKKKRFFESPRAYFGGLVSEQPAFSFVLAKMLEQDPRNRWASMSELATALRDIAGEIVPEIVRDRAARDYNDNLRKNEGFFRSFYDPLFASCDEIAKLFDRDNPDKMSAQYMKLDRAMKLIFNFDPRRKPSSLDDQVESYAALGLRIGYFDKFQDAFMQALRAAQITDEYSHEAWRAVLAPALKHMREAVCRGQA